MKRLVSLLLTAIFLTTNIAAQKAVKPTELVDLFLTAFINQDEASKDKLNDYLRPATNGGQAFPPEVMEILKRMPADSQTAYLSYVKAKDRKKVAPAVLNLYTEFFSKVRQGKCKTTSAVIEKNTVDEAPEGVESERMINGRYVCSFMAPQKDSPSFARWFDENLPKSKATEQASIFEQMAKEMKEGKRVLSLEGEMSLYELKLPDGKSIYMTGDPAAPLSDMLSKFMADIGGVVEK